MMQVALVDQVTKPLAGINAQIDKVSKAGRQGWRNMTMGATTLAAGGMAVQAALGPAIEMDRALGEVASLDVQKDVLDALGREALKLSVQYGNSATEIVRSSYDIQSAIAGLEGNELPAFTRASATLAKATKADTATITNYMGTMYGIFEQQAKRMGKANWVEDVVGKSALAVQLFKTTGQGMADAFGALGANATAAGVSMDEQFAVLGQLQATMGGGEAGTKFKAFLAGVGNAQKALGLQFTDTAGNMLPILTILDKLKARYGETLSVAEGDELRKAFGSNEAVAMIKLLMTNTKGLATNINALANTHGMGKAEQMAASMTDQWERVESAWFAIRAAAFGAILPAVNAVVGIVADGASVVMRWTRLFPNLTKAVSYAILAVVGLGIVTGAWLLLVGVAQLAIAGLGIAFGALAWPILAVVAAIAAMVMWWEPIKAFFGGLISTMAPAISTVFAPWAAILPVIWDGVSSLIGIIAQWLGTTNEASGAFTNMIALGKAAGSILGTVFKLLLSPIWAVGKAIQWVLEKLNLLPGIDLDINSSAPDLNLPDLNLPDLKEINTPIANYRQAGQSDIPPGGIGQQLIQANAAASSANQKPAKSLHIGEVHMHNQNPITPEQLAENAWLETK